MSNLAVDHATTGGLPAPAVPPAAIVSGDPSRRRRWVDHPAAIWGGRVLVLAAWLAVWELAAAQGWINPLFTGRPSRVWVSLVNYAASGQLAAQGSATAQAVLISLAIGVPIGILAGLLLAAFPRVDRILGPFLVPLNSMPRIALVPLFIIWFGLSLTTKVSVAVSIIIFIVLFNARAGVKGIDPDHLVVARQLGLTRREVFQKVVLPGSVPTIFAGVRLAITYALLGVVASEMVAARTGLGLEIVRSANNLRVDGVFAILFVLALAATLIAAGLERFERWLLRWQ